MAAESPDFSKLDILLSDCVEKGDLKPSCLKKHEPLLETLVSAISLYDKAQYDSLNREAKIAFRLNSYLVWLLDILSGLAPNETVFSEKDGRFNRYELLVFGESLSLRKMQNRIWDEFRDERLLLIMPDGAQSGPPFPSQAFTPPETEKRTAQIVLFFVRDPENVRLEKKRLWLNPIFKRWAPKFVFNYGGSDLRKKQHLTDGEVAVINFLFQHAEGEELRSALQAMDFKLYYIPENDHLRLKRA